MANYIIIRLRPETPMTPGTGAGKFTTLVNGLSIQIKDVTTNVGVSPTSVAVHNSGGIKSVASILVNVSSGFNIVSNKIDCRITISDGSGLLVDAVYYSMQVYSAGSLPGTFTGLTANVTLPLPAVGASSSAQRIVLPADGSAPKFALLQAAVSSAGFSAPETMTFADCQTAAQAISLPQYRATMNPPAAPSPTLEEMYSEPASSSTSDFINGRFNYESQVIPVLDAGKQEGFDKTLGFVYALAAAHWGEQQSDAATQIQVKFPPCPLCSGNTAPQPEMSIPVSGSTYLNSGLKVEAGFLYVYGATLPVTITREQRWEMAKLTSAATLMTDFSNALASGIITYPDVNFMDTFRAAHVLNALAPATTSIPIKPLAGLESLIENWFMVTTADQSGYWPGDPAKHLELALWALTDGHQPLITQIMTSFAPFTTQDLVNKSESDWKALFYNSTTGIWSTALFPPTLPAGTPETSFMFLMMRVRKYYSAGTVTVTPATPAAEPIPGLSAGMGDPLVSFINYYNSLGTPEFSYTGQNNPDWVAQALNCTFPGDECAQEWLQSVLDTISALAALTASATTPELQFSWMEALFARGFTDAESILNLTFVQFQQALTGTVVYGFAAQVYGAAGGTMPELDLFNPNFPCVKLIKDEAGAEAAILAVLAQMGIHSNAEVLQIPYEQLLQAFTCAGVGQFLPCIYEAAGGDPNHPEVVVPEGEVFQPVNPEGKLVNCIPQKHRSPLSPAAYLKDLQGLKEDSICKDPVAASSTALSLGEILAGRRGDPGTLHVTSTNQDLPVPLVDIALESLFELVKSPTPLTASGKFHNTATSGYAGLQFAENDPVAMLEALPEHTIPVTYNPSDADYPYNKLRRSVADCCLPYDQALDVNRSYLDQLGLTRFEVLHAFRKNITAFLQEPGTFSDFPQHAWRCPPSYELSLEYLCISQYEMSTLFDYDFVWKGSIETLCDFLEQSCLEYCEFYELSKSGFIKIYADENKGRFPECEACCCDQYEMWVEKANSDLVQITGTVQLNQLIQFTRLWKKLQCLPGAKYSFTELTDIALVLGMFKSNGKFDAGFITELAAFQMLRDAFGLSMSDGQPVAAGATGADRTRLLALWTTGAAGWAVEHLLDRIQHHAQSTYGCECRPPDFIKLLSENLDALSLLVGFIPDNPDYVWYAKPSFTHCFAEILSKIYASDWTAGYILDTFNAGGHLAGDDPFPQQTGNEAIELPFDLPESNDHFSLDELRKKLLAAAATPDDTTAWTWQQMTTVLQHEFGYEPQLANDDWESLGVHFFPEKLMNEGWAVAPVQRRYTVALTSASPAVWNTPAGGPFRYESGNLWTEIPLSDAAVIDKLSRMRQLLPAEQEAVQELYFKPRRNLAQFNYIFSNFNQTSSRLIHEPDEQLRWQFFQEQFGLFYRRCQIIAEYLAAHVEYATGKANKEGGAVAWQILRYLLADETRAFDTVTKTPENWEDTASTDGTLPKIMWGRRPNGGAFSALLGLAGTGLSGRYFRKDGSLIWQELRGGMDAFGAELNRSDLPVPTVISNMNINKVHRFATVRNGIALENADGDMLGGAEGYAVLWDGILMIDNDSSYTFGAGAPTPEGELPDFEKACDAGWIVTLKRGQRRWTLLVNNMPGEKAPAGCSAPVSLKRGAYEIAVSYQQPELSFETKEQSCPQNAGFQLKYKGADSEHVWMTLPHERLFVKYNDLNLSLKEVNGVISDIHSDLSETALEFLAAQCPGSIRNIRATYERAFHALMFAHLFGLSGQPDADDGQSEIGFFLSHPANFRGTGYEYAGSIWSRYFAVFDFNFLPVDDNYYPPADTQDKRRNPSPHRCQAMFDWWRRFRDYTRLRTETSETTEQPVWLLFHEAAEDTNNIQLGSLLRHLGINLGHTDDDFDGLRTDLVTCFYDESEINLKYTITAEDLTNEIWAIRIWEAEKTVRKMLCHFTPRSLRDVNPYLWASPKPEYELGNYNLTEFVTAGLINNGKPQRYLELKTLTDGIRERQRKALITWLIKEAGFKSAGQLSEYLLIDVNAGACQKSARLEEAISAVQLFVNRARLGLEPGFPVSAEFRLLWERQFASYNVWEKCKRREIYHENSIEHEIMEDAGKSETFRFFEERLHLQTLTVPVSGGTAKTVQSAKPPATGTLTLLQKKEAVVMTNLSPAREGFDLMGDVQVSSRPTWLAALPPGKLPFWLESAVRLKLPFLRVAAAGVPPGGITFDCEHGGCCDCCGGEPLPQVSEYYFWLADGAYFEAIGQDINSTWDNPEDLPELLYWKSRKLVYLVWTKVDNGNIGQMRWSAEGVMIDPAATMPNVLEFLGRNADSILFKVKNGKAPVGILPPPDPGFRYDLATDAAIALPAIGQTAASGITSNGLTAHPYFAYFEPGAPLVPVTMFAPALAAACNLRAHCRFEESLHWLELEIKPLTENNNWLDCNRNLNPFAPQNQGGGVGGGGGQNTQHGCCENVTPTDDIATRRALLLHYLEIMVQWGKALIRRNSPEAFQQARLVFDTAAKILGECPRSVEMCDLMDSNLQTIEGFTPDAAPLNPRLLCLYDQVSDGLMLVHDCLNARRLKNGKPNNNMRYWGNSNKSCDCPEDNCSCGDCGCGDDGWCLPTSPYRFTYLLGKSLDLAGTVSSFGGAMIAAIEKGESEQLAALREMQGKQLIELGLDIKKLQYRSADWEHQSLVISLASALYRLKHYVDLIAVGLIQPEKDYISHTELSRDYQVAAKIVFAAAQVLKLIPDLFIGQNNFAWQALGTKAAGILETAAHIIEIFSTIESIEASLSANEGSNARREQEWYFQVDVITFEIEQIKRQLQGAARRRESALRELNNHQVQMQHAAETFDFLRDKFTNTAFYQWQKKELAAMHYQLYECALQTAKQTQAAFNRELGFLCKNFLDCHTWDNLRDGALAGEKLQFALRRMETEYMNTNRREYELTKQVSLFQHFPEAILRLKSTGICEIELLEAMFDQDFAGHYLRRIKSVSLTIPCVAGPYTGVHCRLTLLSSRTRISPILKCSSGCACDSCTKGDHYDVKSTDDSRVIHEYVATEAIATSMAQGDTGLFQLDFRDERLLPFEGFGATSRWRIELPQDNNYFDLHTVSDIIMQVSYTAREAGGKLRELAARSAKDLLPGNGRRLFDLKNDLPEAWFSLHQPGSTLPLQFCRGQFPFLPWKHEMSINCVEIFVEADQCEGCDQITAAIHYNDDCCDGCAPELVLVKDLAWGGMYHGMLSTDWLLSKSNQDFGKLIFPDIPEITRVYLLCCYSTDNKECLKTANCNCGCS